MKKFLVVLCLLLMAVPSFAAEDLNLDEIQKGVEKGDPEAINALGAVYYEGLNGMKQDYAKALELFTKAADAGNAVAMTNIGRIYYFGKGVKKDAKKAAEYFMKAAEKGEPEGQYSLALMYDNGEGGYKKDKKKAAELYRESAEEGYMDAQKNLAAMYYKGDGVKQDKEKRSSGFSGQPNRAKLSHNTMLQ